MVEHIESSGIPRLKISICTIPIPLVCHNLRQLNPPGIVEAFLLTKPLTIYDIELINMLSNVVQVHDGIQLSHRQTGRFCRATMRKLDIEVNSC